MKLFVILLFTFLSVNADSPEDFFRRARAHQNQLFYLQEEINEAIGGAQTYVSQVLRTSTSETLRQYENHINAVEEEYTPHLETFEQLPAGSCKDEANNLLNTIIRFTGFEASNCAKAYDNVVSEKVADANKELVRFDAVYSDIQSFVVKSFIRQNFFVYPQEIESTIVDVLKVVQDRWNLTKPEFEAVRRNLAISIGVENIQLGECHDSILQLAVNQFAWFRSIANTCVEFNTPQRASDRMGKAVEPWVEISKQFYQQFAKIESFEWK